MLSGNSSGYVVRLIDHAGNDSYTPQLESYGQPLEMKASMSVEEGGVLLET